MSATTLDLRQPSFLACDSVTHEGQTNTWFTPREILTALGPFDLDPCTQSFRPFDTAARHILMLAMRNRLRMVDGVTNNAS